jgi:response regulator of citrate/malate metabolism
VKAEKPAKSKAKSKQKVSRPKAVKPKLEDQIVGAMKTDPGKDWTSVEIANAIGAQRTSVQSTMSRMAKDATKIVKVEKGYRLFGPMISAA